MVTAFDEVEPVCICGDSDRVRRGDRQNWFPRNWHSQTDFWARRSLESRRIIEMHLRVFPRMSPSSDNVSANRWNFDEPRRSSGHAGSRTNICSIDLRAIIYFDERANGSNFQFDGSAFVANLIVSRVDITGGLHSYAYQSPIAASEMTDLCVVTCRC